MYRYAAETGSSQLSSSRSHQTKWISSSTVRHFRILKISIAEADRPSNCTGIPLHLIGPNRVLEKQKYLQSLSGKEMVFWRGTRSKIYVSEYRPPARLLDVTEQVEVADH